MEENLIKKLMNTVKCSVCGERYSSDNVRILGRKRDMWFLSMSCAVCDTQALVTAVIEDDGTTANTELTRIEAARFARTGAVTETDLLAMHSFLKGFDGDFIKLFS